MKLIMFRILETCIMVLDSLFKQRRQFAVLEGGMLRKDWKKCVCMRVCAVD
jgi:hypothetical protein